MRLEPTERVNLALSAGVVATSYAVATPHFAISLALGAALEAVNFRALHTCAHALFGGVVVGGRMWVGVLSARLGLVCGGIFLSLFLGADPIGLIIGLSLAMPATVIAAILNRPALLPAEPAAALDPSDPSWDQYSIWRAEEVAPGEDDDE